MGLPQAAAGGGSGCAQPLSGALARPLIRTPPGGDQPHRVRVATHPLPRHFSRRSSHPHPPAVYVRPRSTRRCGWKRGNWRNPALFGGWVLLFTAVVQASRKTTLAAGGASSKARLSRTTFGLGPAHLGAAHGQSTPWVVGVHHVWKQWAMPSLLWGCCLTQPRTRAPSSNLLLDSLFPSPSAVGRATVSGRTAFE